MLNRFILLLYSGFGIGSAIAQPAADYYASADTSSAAALRKSLHEIIDDHRRFPYTSSATDTWDVLEIADEDQDKSGHIITIYRNASFDRQGGGNNLYNREHTWPKSYGFPDNGPDLNYPYTDMHHLFLADTDYNYSRSNKPYDNCDVNCQEEVTQTNNQRGGLLSGYPGDSSWTDGEYTDGRWETWVGRRGDVARALMYMDVRYEGGVHGVTGAAEPDLILTDDRDLINRSNTRRNETVGYMGLLSVLLQWHEQDPVDLIEIQHHETVAAFQGNRNPFIDHPQWAGCVFAGQCKFTAERCDPEYVHIGETSIVIAPTGMNDTDNLQCALKVAVEEGFPLVSLSAATYFIGAIQVENFNGTLAGVSKVSTIVQVLDDSIDCHALRGRGQTPSVIKLSGGAPRVRYMTIRAMQPCMDDIQIQSILHFTGASASTANCRDDVIFGVVDRLVIETPEKNLNGPLRAILASAEGNQLGGCKTTLLGTFKLNRSDIRNFSTGLQTTMKAGAQIDVNFNEFTDNTRAIQLLDGNQNTTITNNKITAVDVNTSGFKGVVIQTRSAQAPNVTRVVINHNEFAISSAAGTPAYAIGASQSGRLAKVSAIITNNTFTLTGSKTRGVSLSDISNPLVAVNRFSGDAEYAVFASGSAPVKAWTITANKGLDGVQCCGRGYLS